MIDVQSLYLFVPIALALNLTPGADMIFCLGQGVKSGPKAGLAASIGVATGSFVHALAGGLGLATLIATNPIAFEIIRWAGVGYLLFLAFKAMTSPIEQIVPTNVIRSDALWAWRAGVIVCLLNPKIAIFMLALVPQFVDPAQGSVLMQFLIFGTILNTGGTIVNGVTGYFAGNISGLLGRSSHVARAFQFTTAFIFVGLALKLASDRR